MSDERVTAAAPEEQERAELLEDADRSEAQETGAQPFRDADLEEIRSAKERTLTAAALASQCSVVLFSGEPEKQKAFTEGVIPWFVAVDAGEVLTLLDQLPLMARIGIGAVGMFLAARAVDPERFSFGRMAQRVKELRSGRGGADGE